MGSKVSKGLNNEALETHNQLRKRHGVPPLKYSKRLASGAQSHAKYLAKHNLFEHSAANNYGENLYVLKGPVDIQVKG
ncbi:unnamed protein product [Dibothriocephalus latus]|uniref:SCP domain-containing protein n=1 Tax=Dibothriocephalus latus TaxID=60516 RepID=A0A3P7LIE1_DIBLA|nr:unnamed protein product [Dibothriocephalus latus]